VHRPLPCCRASYAWVRAVKGGGPIREEAPNWNGNDFNGIGDRDDPISLVMRRRGNPIGQPEFAELAEAFYADALALGERS
jgi:hypothetical protein